MLEIEFVKKELAGLTKAHLISFAEHMDKPSTYDDTRPK